MWPFRKRVEPPKPAPKDRRVWNEDWRVGDTAECIASADDWSHHTSPWNRPAKGARFIVIGFSEAVAKDNTLRYFLTLEGWPVSVNTSSFRKVRPVAVEKSEVVEQILNAKPGADNPRVEA